MRRRAARAGVLASTAAVLTLGLATSAVAAEEGEKKKDDSNMGPPAAAVAGVVLGVAGFALSEKGHGKYPDEHH